GDGRVWALAPAPISSERALAEFVDATEGAQVVCIGAGASATAITVHLLASQADFPIPVVGRTQARLEAMQAIHAKLGPKTPVRYIENGDPRINDRLIAELPPGCLVIHATGMGKDTPGSPFTEAAIYPADGLVCDV